MELQVFDTLGEANINRQKEWDKKGDITEAYRGNEMAGEVGEALERFVGFMMVAVAAGRACNIIKKIARERLGIVGSRATKEQLAEELADVIITAHLCAMKDGIDLDRNVALKFNATSAANGLATRMRVPE